ncbi:hypothetical protein [Shewanella algae]|uniref:hypothetical protein n=1 Tax=Shewanella algae TaxID=38313 RepID=UPI003003F34B
MNMLIQGNESPAKMAILLALTNIRSDAVRGGLTDYFCKGFSVNNAAAFNRLDSANLRRAIARLNQVAGLIEQLNGLALPNQENPCA